MGSVCISGPASRLPEARLEALARTVIAAANKLSYALAGNSATVGFTDLAQLARLLEQALQQVPRLGEAAQALGRTWA